MDNYQIAMHYRLANSNAFYRKLLFANASQMVNGSSKMAKPGILHG